MNSKNKYDFFISLVELATNTGICDADVFDGAPDIDEICASKLYRELLEDCGGSKFIMASVKTVGICGKHASLISSDVFVKIPAEDCIERRACDDDGSLIAQKMQE